MQSPRATQFYSMLNEPLPPTPAPHRQPLTPAPRLGSPLAGGGYYSPSHPQQSPLAATSSSSMFPLPPTGSNNNSPLLHEAGPHIVGPADHYGVHQQQQFASNLSPGNNTIGNSNHNNNRAAASNGHYNKPVLVGLGVQSNGGPSGHNLAPHNGRQSSAPNEQTKVCVIVDSRTPVIIKVPVGPNEVTLRDLKKALPAIDQPSFKYFFKSNDSEFGIVKEEIQDNDCQLPTYRNRVVAWIVTPGNAGDELASRFKSETSDTCNLTYSNTSYDDGSSSVLTTDMESTSYFTETEDDSISCSNYSETTCDTFISQRRNNRHKPSALSKSSPMSNNSSSSLYRATNRHNGHNHNHTHHQRNQNHDRLVSLENISSSSSTSSTSTPTSNSYSDATAVQCVTVHLLLTNENFLGLHIYANAVNGIDEGIYVDGVTENSAVAQDGRIEPGDKLIQVNEVNLEELTNDEAVKVLKDAVIKRGPLKLVVAKFIENNKHDPITGFDREAIHPIDTAAWVAHAQAMTIPATQQQELANSNNSSPSFGSNAQDTDCIRPASTGTVRLGSGLRLNKEANNIKDIIMHMQTPGIGLDIKDRKWLKIHVPQAFLGSDLVRWLERNVQGFTNESEAKKFAARMLTEGYIQDPLSKNHFSPKSFYTFTL